MVSTRRGILAVCAAGGIVKVILVYIISKDYASAGRLVRLTADRLPYSAIGTRAMLITPPCMAKQKSSLKIVSSWKPGQEKLTCDCALFTSI